MADPRPTIITTRPAPSSPTPEQVARARWASWRHLRTVPSEFEI